MQTTILIIHVVISIAIIVLVLLQRGKGADAGASFGGGASGTVFGARGTTSFFSRSTAILATSFFLTSLGLAYLATQSVGSPASSVVDGVEGSQAEQTIAPVENDSDLAPEQAIDSLQDAVDSIDVPQLDEAIDAVESIEAPEQAPE